MIKDVVADLIEGYISGFLLREKCADNLPFRLVRVILREDGVLLQMESGAWYRMTVERTQGE